MARYRLCRVQDIADGGASGFETEGDDVPDIFVVRRGDACYGYVNDCPHWNVPLDFAPGRFLNMQKTQIHCSNHGARFEIETGLCVWGPCQGESLTAAPLDVVDGEVWLDGDRVAPAAQGRWRLVPKRT